MRHWRLYWIYLTIMVAVGIGIVQHFTRTFGEVQAERYKLSPATAEPCTQAIARPSISVCSPLRTTR